MPGQDLHGFRKHGRGLPMSSDIAVRVKNLSKCYQIYDRPQDRLKQFILPRLQRVAGVHPKQYYHEFWSLKDVSFEVKKGETVGIIGRNGAGKSTLLQLICGTLNPTAGNIEINGRVGALLELGAGFNPEFTGRENVYMNGTLLGLHKDEIASRFDEITAFADIGDFIDQPVKMYSSGMYVRLAFSVVAHVNPDILVIDEAFAVGDVFFQQKCIRMLRAFQENGGTILFVSHDTGVLLSLCKKTLLLFSGGTKPPMFGETEEVCKQYLQTIYSNAERKKSDNDCSETEDFFETKLIEENYRKFNADEIPETIYTVSSFRPTAENFGDGGATIIDAGFFDNQGYRLDMIKGEERVHFAIRARALRYIHKPAFGFMLKNNLGEYLYTEGTDLHFRNYDTALKQGDEIIANFKFVMPHLIRGKYTMNVALADCIGDDHTQCHWIHDAIQIECISNRIVHGFSGMNGISMNIEIFPANLSEEVK